MTYLPFPYDISENAPPGIIASLSAAEFGILIRLMEFAWNQDPPCTLPGTTAYMAQITLAPAEHIEQLVVKLGPAIARDSQYRICFPMLARKHQESLRRREQQRTAGKVSGLVRRTNGCSTDDERTFNTRSTHVQLDARIEERACAERSAPERSFSENELERSAPERSNPMDQFERPAPERSISIQEFQRSLGALSAVVFNDLSSAGARARAVEGMIKWRKDEASTMLSTAIRGWREQGLFNAPLHNMFVFLKSPYATAPRIFAAIAAVNDRIAVKDCRNAYGLLAAKLGASHKSRGKPMVIPPTLAEEWDKREADALSNRKVSFELAARLDEARLRNKAKTMPPKGDGDVPPSEGEPPCVG